MLLKFERVSTQDSWFLKTLREHYTGSRGAPYGKKLGYIVFADDDEPIAALGLGEPTFKLAARRRLGLEDGRPLPYTVNNFLYRRVSNLGPSGSHLLRTWHEIASDDWETRYGWRPVHWETLVDPAHVPGSVPGLSYLRIGYRQLGMTTGRTVRRPTHGRREWADGPQRLVLYRGPLVRRSEVS
jgi:hypothetical protein